MGAKASSQDAAAAMKDDFAELPMLRIKKKHKVVQVIRLLTETYSLGRSENNRICLPDNQISGNHAEIYWKDGRWWIRDLQSRNGTHVNNRRIDTTPLAAGDIIALGDIQCLFELSKQAQPPGCYRLGYMPWVAGALLAIFICSLLWVLGRNIWWSKRLGMIASVPGNLLDDASFEESFGWQIQGKMAIVQTFAQSGHASLSFSSKMDDNSVKASIHEAASDVIALRYGKTYKVAAGLYYQNLQGVAGVKLKWFNNKNAQILTESYSPLVTGNTSSWQRLEYLAYPPAYAEYVKLYCFVAGKADALYFDDIELTEAAGKNNTGIETSNLRCSLDHRGVLEVYQGADLILGGGKVVVWDTNKDLLASQTFAIGKMEQQPETMVWKGRLYCLTDSKVLGELRVECRIVTDGLQIKIRLVPLLTIANVAVEYMLGMPPAYMHKKVKFGSNQAKFSPGKLPTSIDAPIAYIVWETAGNQWGLFYDQPTKLKLTPSEYVLHLHHSLVMDHELEWAMVIRNNLLRHNQLLQKLQDLAAQAEQDHQWGDAAVAYQEISDKFMFHVAAEAAQKRVAELNQLFAQELTDLEQQLQRARFFKIVPFYRPIKLKIEKLTASWNNYPPATQLASLQSSVAEELKALDQEQQHTVDASLAQIAEKYEAEQKFALAILNYQQIMEQVADATARERALQKIATLAKKSGTTPNK